MRRKLKGAAVVLGLALGCSGLAMASDGFICSGPPNEWHSLLEGVNLTSWNYYPYDRNLRPKAGADSLGNVHIVWSRDNSTIRYSKLDNNGGIVVDDIYVGSNSNSHPALGIDTFGNMHIAWSSSFGGIHYTKLNNNGGTVVGDTTITTNGSSVPEVGADNSGNAHIVWKVYNSAAGVDEIYYAKLDSNGNPVVNATQVLTCVSGQAQTPALGVDGSGNLHVAWSVAKGGLIWEIYYAKLDNNGNPIVNSTRLSTDLGSYYADTTLGVDSYGNVHIAWLADQGEFYKIYYTKLNNNGNTLMTAAQINTVSAYGSYMFASVPSLAVDSLGNVHLAWSLEQDYPGAGKSYYTKLDNAGQTLLDDIELAYTAPFGINPSLTVDGSGNVHMAWEHWDVVEYKSDIYYAKGYVSSPSIYYRDADGDGCGDINNSIQSCPPPAGYVPNSVDCNDSNPAIHSGAPEICDGLDNNCDGQVDEGIVQNTYYRDADGDGYGNPIVTIQSCSIPSGYVSDNTDCNDSLANVYPGAAEVCDGLDNNCDGQIDEGVKNTYYRDADGDGYGDSAITIQACSLPAGYAVNSGDCNDGNAAINPGAAEVCDGVDNNCDGLIDETCLPNAPGNLTTTAVSRNEIRLNWADNSNNEQGFIIMRKDGKCSSTAQWVQIDTVPANTTSYSNQGLPANTTYAYKVQAYNGVGSSAFTNCASTKTLR